jgi:phosphotransferase system HPr-like phosphotransfer protein
MARAEVTVVNRLGLHARPSAKVTAAAGRFARVFAIICSRFAAAAAVRARSASAFS